MASTFSELWNELKAEAVAEIAKLKAEVADFEHTIVPVIESDVASVLSQFKNLAVTTVLNLAKAEMSVLTGAEKQSTVVTTVFQAVEAAGKEVAIQDVRMLAQQAFDAVGSALAPPP